MDDSENGPSKGSAGTAFALIHSIRHAITRAIDTVMSYDQLNQTPADYAVVKPLTTLLAKTRHPALPYALLLCRSSFLEESEKNLAFQGVNATRAALCEVLATKLLSLYDSRSLELATILTTWWNPLAGASRASFEQEVQPTQAELDDMLQDGEDVGSSAIELAIETRALRFIRCPPVQHFVDDLYSGHILYRPSSQHSIISDNYKSKAIEPYNVTTRGIWDHYILRVPRIRRLVELGTILILIVLFLVLQNVRDIGRVATTEVLFIIFALGFALDEAAAVKERGFKLYSQQIWNVLDMVFLATFFSYFVTRMIGLHQHNRDISTLAFDILALGACALAPRLCGMLLRDSLVMLGLRAMLVDFFAFLGLALICSFGFIISLTILADGRMSMSDLAWLCAKIALGSSYLGFEAAPDINATLAPWLMLVYAVFSNILLLTILVSILTNTFSLIQFNVTDEALYQRACSTLDMVMGGALFEFLVPTNLVALPLLLPASFCLSERRFHQFNVFLIRLTNFPLLVLIWIYYKCKATLLGGAIRLSEEGQGSAVWDSLPRGFRKSAAQKVFQRKVSKEGRRVREMEPPAISQEVKPVAIRGSGGLKALDADSSPSSTTGLPQTGGLLAQFFSSNSARGTSPSRPSASDEKAAAMQKQLDNIEALVTQLVTGGIKLGNDDR